MPKAESEKMNIEFVKVSTAEDICALAQLTDEVWHEYFPCILSEEQIDYMVDKFQSEHAISEQLASGGYEYRVITADGKKAGYVGFVRESEKMFLSKLYLLKAYRGRQIASRALEFLKTECKKGGLDAIYLTVNRHNTHTIDVYKRWGFEVVREQCADIGNGYVMDDYVMELALTR